MGAKGNDKLMGGAGDDWLKAGSGDDVMKGGGGADLFQFKSGDDVIKDFDGAEGDVVDLRTFDLRSLNEVKENAQNVGDDLVITLGDDTLTLFDTQKGDLAADDFML